MADDDEVAPDDLLKGFDNHVRDEFASMPRVDDVGDALDLSKLAIEARRWARVNEVVAVVADLKDSTRRAPAASEQHRRRASCSPTVRTRSSGNCHSASTKLPIAILKASGSPSHHSIFQRRATRQPERNELVEPKQRAP
jgi:hypothetical protein